MEKSWWVEKRGAERAARSEREVWLLVLRADWNSAMNWRVMDVASLFMVR